jgi:hypothetical protein
MSGNGEFLDALRLMTIVPVPSSDASPIPLTVLAAAGAWKSGSRS